jgi:hypothetical protein
MLGFSGRYFGVMAHCDPIRAFKRGRFLVDFGMFLQIISIALATVKAGIRVQGSGVKKRGSGIRVHMPGREE